MVVGDVPTAVDVLVLGAGPAGYTAAIRAAQLGRHVTLVEREKLGGVCLNRGCIPLKALLTASERYAQAVQAELATMGIQAERVSFDWSKMQAWKQSIVERLVEGVRRLIAGNRIELVKGTAWFINAQEVRVEGEHTALRYKFKDCVIAVGAQATSDEQIACDGQTLLTPEQALALPSLPEAISICGNDYIALELATLFSRLNVQVKLYAQGEQLLDGVDPIALRLVQAGLRKMGVQLATKISAERIKERPLVLSRGVRPDLRTLHLHEAGVQVSEEGGIIVDSMQQSTMSHIYAVGDCTGQGALASVALKQGKIAAEVLCGQRVQFAPLVTPLVVHTTPELATVGLSSEEATRAGYTVMTGRFPLAANGRALTLGSDNGVALLVANASDGLLLGTTIVGPRAGDLIEQAALAIEMGATLTDLSEILYAHPSLSEMVQESAEAALGKAIHILK